MIVRLSCLVYAEYVPFPRLAPTRIAIAIVYWLAVIAVFILSERRIVPGIWEIVVTLPWSFVPTVIFFAAFFIGNANEWSSQAALTIFDFVILVVICGGLNAVLIGGIVRFGQGAGHKIVSHGSRWF